jgi:formylglycine-generating enzyme required for sulfatase activity
VTVRDFYIGKYEVTQAEWRQVMGSNPSSFKDCDNCPVETVMWNDVQEYIKKLNARTGKTYRLPTEAEWEYAARGGSRSQGYWYSGSNTLADVGWYDDNSGGKTKPVGTRKANELGIYDMSGNVWEWVEDDWHGSYTGAPTDGRAWVDSGRGSRRVPRGGGWGSTARHCRAACRNDSAPAYRLNFIGFRLALQHTGKPDGFR